MKFEEGESPNTRVPTGYFRLCKHSIIIDFAKWTNIIKYDENGGKGRGQGHSEPESSRFALIPSYLLQYR